MSGTLIDPDRDARRVWTLLAVAGGILCIAGWLSWLGVS